MIWKDNIRGPAAGGGSGPVARPSCALPFRRRRQSLFAFLWDTTGPSQRRKRESPPPHGSWQCFCGGRSHDVRGEDRDGGLLPGESRPRPGRVPLRVQGGRRDEGAGGADLRSDACRSVRSGSMCCCCCKSWCSGGVDTWRLEPNRRSGWGCVSPPPQLLLHGVEVEAPLCVSVCSNLWLVDLLCALNHKLYTNTSV